MDNMVVMTENFGPWAVRYDHAGWRSVTGPEDIIEGLEYFLASEDGPPPEIVPLPMNEAQALAERDRLLGIAAIRIAPLQDAVDLGIATEEETALLLKWKQYRVALNRIQTQPGFPGAVNWPVAPS